MIWKAIKWLLAIFVLALAGLFIWGYAADVPLAELKAKYANAESEFVDLGEGLTVHLRDEGPADAPAIILLHGSNASLHTWDEWTQRMKDKYRIIRFDQPGHGLTGPHPKDDYSVAAFADVVDRVAANRRLGRFTLGGNSMGGGIAYEYAKTHPEKLAGLILVDSGGQPEAKPTALPIGFRIMQWPVINELATIITPRSIIDQSLRSSVSKGSYIDDAEVDLYWELLRRSGNREATIKRFGHRSAQPKDAFDPKPLATPALILWGEEDRLIPVSSAAWFAKRFPDSRTHIYKGIGHIPMQELPDESARDVIEWMAREAPTPAR